MATKKKPKPFYAIKYRSMYLSVDDGIPMRLEWATHVKDASIWLHRAQVRRAYNAVCFFMGRPEMRRVKIVPVDVPVNLTNLQL